MHCTAKCMQIQAAYFTWRYYERAVYAKWPWKISSIRLTAVAASRTFPHVVKFSFVTI